MVKVLNFQRSDHGSSPVPGCEEVAGSQCPRALSRPSVVRLHLLMVMLCLNPAYSLGWSMPSSLQGESRETLRKLRQLQNVPSGSCIHDGINFRFPWKPHQFHETEATCFYHQMLDQIFNLFHTEDSHAPWGDLLLSQLLASLHYQQTELAKVQNLTCPDLGNVVRNYFRRIASYLQKKKYSPCAWERVRREIEERLFLLVSEAASEES
uniref:Interferon 1GA1 n=1 Tax=Tupaia belangeri TaxID=37347 RepID=A0A7R8GV66_TUPBE|nr:TPA: interferon 1GA1 [Tupaia belangeri]